MKKCPILLLAFAALILSSCGNREGDREPVDYMNPTLNHADSLVSTAIYSIDRREFWAGDKERANFLVDSLKNLIDSLENIGELNELGADQMRGSLYYYALRDEEAEECYRHAVTHNTVADRKQWYYNSAANQLAYLMYMRHNYEGFLRVAVPLLASMDSLGNGLNEQKINLYTLMACCYVKLERPDEARSAAARARAYCNDVLAVDSSEGVYMLFINAFARIKDAYVRVKNYEEARRWMDFTDSVGEVFARLYPDANVQVIYRGYSHLDRAIRLHSLGQVEEAAAEYEVFNEFDSCSLNALIQSNDYLMQAGRYAEAARHYEVLDHFIDKPYLEEIGSYYFPKLRANYYAGRKDSALNVAMQIADFFDSALVWQKRSEMAEMATVYDTQGKEMQIAKQQARITRQRLWGTGAALVLLTLFFIVYSWYRRRAQKRLSIAHEQLKTAYDQLEETTTAKERIESELRIARDIQMSMVPGVFPEYKGLDMFAAMTPAKEVGGDLYGYVVQGDNLYFCVGDVSGKGVPASLFMAQSARLFRTFSAEGMMPANIAARMNNELTDGNDNGMFVTMFIGLLHLDTGQLDYCNCGHNAPVLDGQFMEMQYVNQPLGLWEDDPFYGESIDDIRGRQLLVYSDGLNEAENPQKQLLGNARLLELMASARSLSAHEVIEMLMKAVELHRAGAVPNDDLTLMCLRLTKPDTKK